jgi:hypothetical protein
MQPQFTYNSSTAASTTVEQIPFVRLNTSGGDNPFGDIGSIFSFFTSDSFIELLYTLWTYFSIASYILCIIMLVLYVYASTRRNLYSHLADQQLRDAEKMYDEHYRGTAKNSRMQDVLTHSSSANPGDWKLAIIEADIILDDILKEQGYVGNSLGERLKSISPQQLASLNDAWEAHKVRNKIAHDGSDFIVTKRVAQETIVKYQRVFTELGVS